MRFVFSALVCSILFFSCGNHVNSPATGLRVSDPDHLYFKNVRVNLYSAIEDNELHKTHYTHRKFKDNAVPVRLVIVDNWIHSRAYLKLAIENDIAKGTILELGDEQGKRFFSVEKLSDRKALNRLKAELSGNTQVCYVGMNVIQLRYCFAVGSPAREALRVTILDFLKLTELEDGRTPG